MTPPVDRITSTSGGMDAYTTTSRSASETPVARRRARKKASVPLLAPKRSARSTETTRLSSRPPPRAARRAISDLAERTKNELRGDICHLILGARRCPMRQARALRAPAIRDDESDSKAFRIAIRLLG